MSTEDTLKKRQSVHGDFADNAKVADAMLSVMEASQNWDSLKPFMRIALIYIVGKISRILSGDENYEDHWHDIGGYAKCVEDRLPKTEEVIRLEVPSKLPPISCKHCNQTLPGSAHRCGQCGTAV